MESRSRRRLGSVGYVEHDPNISNYVRVGDRLVPPQIDVTMPGAGDQPQLYMRLAVVKGIPQAREVRVFSDEGDRDVKQLDLSAVRVAEIVNEVFGMLSLEVLSEANGVLTVAEHGGDEAQGKAVQHIAEARKGRGARKITSDFLAEIAEVYRQNIDGNPAEAVRIWTGVSARMAGNYIRRAREAGLLPQTTGGKKKA